MKKTILAVAAALVLAASVPAFAVQIGVSIGGPQAPVVVAPAPAPVVVAPAPAAPMMAGPMVQFQYYPAYNIYFDPGANLYWSQVGGRWVSGPLPRNINRNRLGRPEIVSAPNNPWEHRGDHRGPAHRGPERHDDHRGHDRHDRDHRNN